MENKFLLDKPRIYNNIEFQNFDMLRGLCKVIEFELILHMLIVKHEAF